MGAFCLLRGGRTMKKSLVLSLLLIFLTSVALAGTINLPRTGQTKCYGLVGNITAVDTEIPCAGTGQDGNIQAGVPWPDPRFTDNDDDTMTDNLTGLMWTKDANLPDNDLIWLWRHAMDYVEGMNAGTYPNFGYTDWRLPNVNELESLVNMNEAWPNTWLNSQGFTNVQADYWSSTTCFYWAPECAWLIAMWSGDVFYSGKSDFSRGVWPVRSEQCGSFDNSVICLPQTGQIVSYATGDDGDLKKGVAWPIPRFIDYGDNTVTDVLTGLMWTKDANLPNGTMDWYWALDYVERMNAGKHTNYGYTDWRLPNRKELQSLTDYSRHNPALPADHPFTNVQTDYYWSSTSHAEDSYDLYSYPFFAWIVYMYSGYVDDEDKGLSCGVWPVRGGRVGEIGLFLSGKVTMKDTNIPLPEVTMALSGTVSGTTSTDSNGNYGFSGLAKGTYKITPIKSGYKFSPKSKSVKVKSKDVTNKNFKGKHL
jgi:hypothetical protein